MKSNLPSDILLVLGYFIQFLITPTHILIRVHKKPATKSVLIWQEKCKGRDEHLQEYSFLVDYVEDSYQIIFR